MPRALRRIEPGACYHVLNRGNRRRRIFRKPEDYQAFVQVLGEALRRYRVDLLCWCLMSNHWHLVLRPHGDERELPAFMRWLTVTHVRRHHGHHGRAAGHVYQGRYKCFCVKEDSYFLTLCRYVESNPLRAKLVKRAQDWPWSSLSQRLGRRSSPTLSPWPVDRPLEWTKLVNRALAESELDGLRASVERERPLGPRGWVQRVAKRLGLEQTLRPRGRPQKPLEALSPRQRRRRLSGHNRK